MMLIIPKTPLAHPTVKRLLQKEPPPAPAALALAALRSLALEAGADDMAAVTIEHPELAEERSPVLNALPTTRTLMSLVSVLGDRSFLSTFAACFPR